MTVECGCKIPPIYTATSVFIPIEGVMENVSGRNNATAIDAESPGMEPKIMPTATPAIISRREAGWHTLTNAFPNNPKACIISLLIS